MLNFDFYNPTKIVFGVGGLSRLAELTSFSKILILYGQGSIKENGIYDLVKNSLGDKDLFEVSGVMPNPNFDKALEAIELIKKNQIEFILAVGGGSVIDCAKFISLAIFYDGDPWDLLTKKDLELTWALPIGTVLTLPATGSEMNKYFVISKGNEKLSSGSELCFPVFSILDPALTLSLNQKQIGNGIVDSFIHVMEQYLTYDVNSPLQDQFSEATLRTIIEEGTKTFYRPKDLESRSSFMWSTTIALNGFLGCGVPQDWSTHMISHELTALYGIDHARTLAIIFPSVMWVMRQEKFKKIKQYAERIWNIKVDDDISLDQVITLTKNFFESVGVPTTLKSYGLGYEVVDQVSHRLERRGFSPLGETESVTIEKVRQILSRSVE
jgi:NADP-dependent alcohol dehydrogenase